MGIRRGVLFLVVALHLLASPVAGGQQADVASPAAQDCSQRPALYDPRAPAPAKMASALGPVPAWLADLPVGFVPSNDACLGPVPVYRAGVVAPGSQADTHLMARRLAPGLAAFSAQSGLEACARMCQRPDGRIVVQVVTLRAHISCAAPQDTCPTGSTALQETIHSHPPQTVFMANAVDAVGWEEPELAGKLSWAGNADLLSPADRQAAPVWLVTGKGRLVWLASPHAQEVERP